MGMDSSRHSLDRSAQRDQRRYRGHRSLPLIADPSVISVFERKWQSLPRFQRTRGVLRLLALWVSHNYQGRLSSPGKRPRKPAVCRDDLLRCGIVSLRRFDDRRCSLHGWGLFARLPRPAGRQQVCRRAKSSVHLSWPSGPMHSAFHRPRTFALLPTSPPRRTPAPNESPMWEIACTRWLRWNQVLRSVRLMRPSRSASAAPNETTTNWASQQKRLTRGCGPALALVVGWVHRR
jgi:hypothetical protein